MSAESPQAVGAAAQIGELWEHARFFASHVPGPLRLIRMQAGDVSIEVQWHDAAAGSPAGAASDPAPGEAGPADPDGVPAMLVTAPMVGTFYRAPSPGADPFVQVGDFVQAGQTIGIVEAMKLMNSVTAECSGHVTEVLAQDAMPVEFGQPLVSIATAELADAMVGAAGS